MRKHFLRTPQSPPTSSTPGFHIERPVYNYCVDKVCFAGFYNRHHVVSNTMYTLPKIKRVFIIPVYFRNISTAQISVVTYGLLRHPSSKVLQEALFNQDFQVMIADESHYIKNRKAATTKYLVPLLKKARRKILLTGTPALARPEEVLLVTYYKLLKLLYPTEFKAENFTFHI